MVKKKKQFNMINAKKYRTSFNYKEDIQILGPQVEYYYHTHIKYGVHLEKLKIYYYDLAKT